VAVTVKKIIGEVTVDITGYTQGMETVAATSTEVTGKLSEDAEKAAEAVEGIGKAAESAAEMFSGSTQEMETSVGRVIVAGGEVSRLFISGFVPAFRTMEGLGKSLQAVDDLLAKTRVSLETLASKTYTINIATVSPGISDVTRNTQGMWSGDTAMTTRRAMSPWQDDFIDTSFQSEDISSRGVGQRMLGSGGSLVPGGGAAGDQTGAMSPYEGPATRLGGGGGGRAGGGGNGPDSGVYGVGGGGDGEDNSGSLNERNPMGTYLGMYAAQTLGHGISDVGSTLLQPLKEGVETMKSFTQELQNMGAAAGISQPQIDQMGKSILEMAHDPLIISTPTELAHALFFIESAGFSGQKALDALRESAYGATAGIKDVAVAAKLEGTLIDSGIKGTETLRKTMDTVIYTASKAQATYQAYATSMGNLIPPARMLGLTLQEVGAGQIALTRQDMPIRQANVDLAALFRSIQAPTAQTLKLISANKELGVSYGDTALRGRPFIDWLNDAHEKMQRYAEDHKAIKVGSSVRPVHDVGDVERAMFPRQQALTAFADLTRPTQPQNSYEEISKGMGQATQGAGATMDKAQTQIKGLADQFAILTKNVELASITIGNILIPPITTLLGIGNSLLTWFNSLSPGMQSFITYSMLIGGVLLSVIGALISFGANVAFIIVALQGAGITTAMVGAGIAALGPILLTVGDVIAVIAAAWEIWSHNLGHVQEYTQAFTEWISREFAILWPKITSGISTFWSFAKREFEVGWQYIEDGFHAVAAGIVQIVVGIVETIEILADGWNWVRKEFAVFTAWFTGEWDALAKMIHAATTSSSTSVHSWIADISADFNWLSGPLHSLENAFESVWHSITNAVHDALVTISKDLHIAGDDMTKWWDALPINKYLNNKESQANKTVGAIGTAWDAIPASIDAENKHKKSGSNPNQSPAWMDNLKKMFSGGETSNYAPGSKTDPYGTDPATQKAMDALTPAKKHKETDADKLEDRYKSAVAEIKKSIEELNVTPITIGTKIAQDSTVASTRAEILDGNLKGISHTLAETILTLAAHEDAAKRVSEAHKQLAASIASSRQEIALGSNATAIQKMEYEDETQSVAKLTQGLGANRPAIEAEISAQRMLALELARTVEVHKLLMPLRDQMIVQSKTIEQQQIIEAAGGLQAWKDMGDGFSKLSEQQSKFISTWLAGQASTAVDSAHKKLTDMRNTVLELGNAFLKAEADSVGGLEQWSRLSSPQQSSIGQGITDNDRATQLYGIVTSLADIQKKSDILKADNPFDAWLESFKAFDTATHSWQLPPGMKTSDYTPLYDAQQGQTQQDQLTKPTQDVITDAARLAAANPFKTWLVDYQQMVGMKLQPLDQSQIDALGLLHQATLEQTSLNTLQKEQVDIVTQYHTMLAKTSWDTQLATMHLVTQTWQQIMAAEGVSETTARQITADQAEYNTQIKETAKSLTQWQLTLSEIKTASDGLTSTLGNALTSALSPDRSNMAEEFSTMQSLQNQLAQLQVEQFQATSQGWKTNPYQHEIDLVNQQIAQTQSKMNAMGNSLGAMFTRAWHAIRTGFDQMLVQMGTDMLKSQVNTWITQTLTKAFGKAPAGLTGGAAGSNPGAQQLQTAATLLQRVATQLQTDVTTLGTGSKDLVTASNTFSTASTKFGTDVTQWAAPVTQFATGSTAFSTASTVFSTSTSIFSTAVATLTPVGPALIASAAALSAAAGALAASAGFSGGGDATGGTIGHHDTGGSWGKDTTTINEHGVEGMIGNPGGGVHVVTHGDLQHAVHSVDTASPDSATENHFHFHYNISTPNPDSFRKTQRQTVMDAHRHATNIIGRG
jgi:TP901 family phage tail tape measure protein